MNFKTKPFQHQLEALEELKNLNWKGIFFDMGTGKTKLAIDIIRHKCYQQNKVLKTLIVAPKVALKNWQREFEIHSSLEPYTVILDGTAKQRRDKLFSHNKRIFIINYEGIATILDYLTKELWDIIIADESQRIKNPKSIRTKNMILLSKIAVNRFILSGTPILNSPMDIFSQALFLDYGNIFSNNFFAFRNKFFIDTNASMARFIPREKYYPKYELNPAKENEFKRKVAELGLVKTKDECLDLPPKIYQTLELEIPKEYLSVYKSLEKDLIAVLDDDDAIVAANAAVARIRLRQVTSGFMALDGPNKVTKLFKAQPKLKTLQNILEQLIPSHKVIIWACWRSNIFMLLKELKQYNPACIFGDTKNVQKEADKFNNDVTCKVMIANPQAGGVAINLIAASYVIYYSQSSSLEHRKQSEDRCHRSGSEIHKKITYITLCFKNSVDEIIMESLYKKEDLTNNIKEFAKRLRARKEVR